MAAAHGHRHVTLFGDIDLAAAGRVREVLTGAVEQSISVEVDLAHVTFLDSSGINALVAASKAARVRGHAFVVTSPSAPARRVLDITGLLAVLTGAAPA